MRGKARAAADLTVPTKNGRTSRTHLTLDFCGRSRSSFSLLKISPFPLPPTHLISSIVLGLELHAFPSSKSLRKKSESFIQPIRLIHVLFFFSLFPRFKRHLLPYFPVLFRLCDIRRSDRKMMRATAERKAECFFLHAPRQEEGARERM